MLGRSPLWSVGRMHPNVRRLQGLLTLLLIVEVAALAAVALAAVASGSEGDGGDEGAQDGSEGEDPSTGTRPPRYPPGGCIPTPSDTDTEDPPYAGPWV